MRAVDIIAKKRDGQPLTDVEIQWMIQTYTEDGLPDYQMAAFLMAVCIRGMNNDELSALTLAMAHSGEMLDLSVISDYVVDKHSSGGVGDKTSLVVLPLVASCGVPVAKMSGRGLGYTGGTLDKLEAIEGFQVDLSDTRFLEQAKSLGLVISGQSQELAPADGKLYALRDVTATVPSIPLIASSIMSKKLASGADGIVLDVKVGQGAFMRDLVRARELAVAMVDIGTIAGRDVVSVISDMNQPLGQAVGHSIEVVEAIETLQGGGPADFRSHCLEIASHMLRLFGRGEKWTQLHENLDYLAGQLQNGQAMDKFRQMVKAQGGNVRLVNNPSLLPQAELIETLTAAQDGYIEQVAADKVALAAFELGAGRLQKGDQIDLAVGVKVYIKVGDAVSRGDTIASIYANNPATIAASRRFLNEAITYSSEPVGRLPLFYDVVGAD